MFLIFAQMRTSPVYVPPTPQNDAEATAQILGYLTVSGLGTLLFLSILIWLYVKRDRDGRDTMWVLFLGHLCWFLLMLLALR